MPTVEEVYANSGRSVRRQWKQVYASSPAAKEVYAEEREMFMEEVHSGIRQS